MATKFKLAKKINEIVQPYCNCNWCILKEILCCNHQDPRFFVQLKCIEHRKFELSEKKGYDVGWEAAHMEWVNSGCAVCFAEFYDEDLTAEQIYEKIIKCCPIESSEI